MQAEIPHTNWRLSTLTFLPSAMIAEPSSPSRVRYAAPNTWRALDRSGRLCKTSPLRKKGGSQKGKGKNKVKITLCLTSTGILMEGDYTHHPFQSLSVLPGGAWARTRCRTALDAYKRRVASAGGKARAKKLSATRRKEIATKASKAAAVARSRKAKRGKRGGNIG